MADQAPLSPPEPLSSDTDPSAGIPSVTGLVRHDTTSTCGSAKPIPKGRWKLDLSGNCPRCHHHHEFIQVQVRVSSDLDHVGEVYCDNCERLWLDFGRRNSTRLSLLSMKTIEPDPLEKAFHSTLVHMIRSATAVATLSSTLADIPESSSAGLTREPVPATSPRRGLQNMSQSVASNVTAEPVAPLDNTAYDQEASSSTQPLAPRGGASLSKPHAAVTSQLVSRLRKKIREKFPMLETVRLSRWIKPTEEKGPSPSRYGKQPALETKPLPLIPTLPDSEDHDVENGAHTDAATETNHNAIDVCTPSTSAAEALEALKTLDQEAIKAMDPKQRTDWMRRQLTAFKQHATPLHPSTVPIMVNTGAQVDEIELPLAPSSPPSRRHSALAFVGNNFGTFHYWELFRASNVTLNGRPRSMSDTNLSEADTAVEGMSVTSTPRHILLESLQRDRRGSSSSRPHSIVQNWQQIRQNRAEARWSFDSAATGGAVRSIPSARGRALNRLSRSSMAQAMSQVQLAQPTSEESEPSSGQEHHSPPSPLPPTTQ
ncbi:Nn.00g008800.m01.CDS01 [Neocucurbitaria sp. VM-36]